MQPRFTRKVVGGGGNRQSQYAKNTERGGEKGVKHMGKQSCGYQKKKKKPTKREGTIRRKEAGARPGWEWGSKKKSWLLIQQTLSGGRKTKDKLESGRGKNGKRESQDL